MGETDHAGAGSCVSPDVLLKQLAELQTQCQSAFDPHGTHAHRTNWVGETVHSWHHHLKQMSSVMTITFETVAVLTVFAGGVSAFLVAASLGWQWLRGQMMYVVGMDAPKPKDPSRELAGLRSKDVPYLCLLWAAALKPCFCGDMAWWQLCGSIALGLNFLLAAEVTEQLAADPKENAWEVVLEALGFLIMVIVRAAIGYEANKEMAEAQEHLEHTLEALSSFGQGGIAISREESAAVIEEMIQDPVHGEELLLKSLAKNLSGHGNFASSGKLSGMRQVQEEPAEEGSAPAEDLMGDLAGGARHLGNLLDESDSEDTQRLHS